MAGWVVCDPRERPEVGHPRQWLEVQILPFDRRMARAADDGWLQWTPRECIPIPGWLYCLLGFAWPLLRLVYRRPLLGQSTDYGVR